MAAFRRAVALASKLNLWSAARVEFTGGQAAGGGRAGRRLGAGVCVATGSALALYFYNDMTSGRRRGRRSRSINDLLPSIPAVEAKEKVGIELNACFICNNNSFVSSMWPLCAGIWCINRLQTKGIRGQRAFIVQYPSAKVRATELRSDEPFFLFTPKAIADERADKLCHSFPAHPVETVGSLLGCGLMCARRCGSGALRSSWC